MITLDEILDVLRQHSREIEQLGVERLGVFGSVVRNEQIPGSDVDILVEFRPGEKTFRHFIKLKYLLEDLLCGIRVDLVTEKGVRDISWDEIQESVIYPSRPLA